MEFPTDELAAVAWVKTLDGIDPTKVATKLPADASTWAATGFIVAEVVGGGAAIDTPLYGPVIRFHCWAANLNSTRAPWGRASSLAQRLQWFASNPQEPAPLTLPAGLYPARFLSAYPVGAIVRVPSDEAGFAHVYLDVRIHWTVDAS